MKRQYILTILICLAAIFSLQFLGCSNLFSQSLSNSGENGNVTVSFSSNLAKAVLSPGTMNFDTYDFIFYQRNGDSQTISKTSGPFKFSLKQKTEYTLEVKAYKGTGPGRVLAAEGTSEPFTVSSNTNVTVNLQGVTTGTGEGTFTWDISSVPGTLIDELLLYMTESKYYDLKDVEDFNSASGTQQVTAGRYLLIARLSRLDGTIVGYVNGVEIYPGQTTSYEKVFTLNDFKDPNIENDGITVEKWHGFNISGKHDYDPPGNPKSTLYKAYNDGTGRIGDVLKLETPAGGYETGSYAMTYKAPIAGRYKLSMKVKIDSPPGKDIIFGFEHIDEDGGWEIIAGDLENPTDFPANTWVTITYDSTNYPNGIYLDENDTFGLNTKQDGSNHPEINNLDNCTIYFKDLLLEVDTDHGNVTLIGGVTSGLRITPQSLVLFSKDSIQLELSGDITGGRPTWTSSDTNESSIILDQSGRITVKTIKESKDITVKVTSGDYEAQAQIRVFPKLIALTFDDGPDPEVTPTVLQYLKNAKDTDGKPDPVHATFFLIGKSAENNHDLVNAITADGHEIGSHSYSHNPDIYYDYEGVMEPEDYREELINAQNIIWGITGKAPMFFRPPYVTTRPNLKIVIEEMGLPRITGELLEDWDRDNKWETIRNNALEKAKPWGILILHDYEEGSPPYPDESDPDRDWVGNGLEMVKALPSIIEKLREDGYELVTINEMMNRKKVFYLEPGEEYDTLERVPSDSGFPGSIVKVTSLLVYPPTTEVNPFVLNMTTNPAITAKPTVFPSNATRSKVYWYSEDDSIASVDSSGTITGESAGTTIIYACAEGRMDKVYVKVTDYFDPASWENFNYAGYGTDHTAANAIGEVTSYGGYGNVLKLSPGEGGYFNNGSSPDDTVVAMAITVPTNATYVLSMYVYIVKNENHLAEPVKISWESDAAPYQVAGNWNTELLGDDKWYRVDDDGIDGGHKPSGEYDRPAFLVQGDKIFLVLRDSGDNMLNDATIYIRDLVLKRDTVDFINIPSVGP